jgi:CRP/FNR family transcriptional regulator, anaerobic regulatory protein
LSANVVHLPMTRTDIADYLGLTTETVSRTFSQFRRDGLINLTISERVGLTNVAALSQLAAGLRS